MENKNIYNNDTYDHLFDNNKIEMNICLNENNVNNHHYDFPDIETNTPSNGFDFFDIKSLSNNRLNKNKLNMDKNPHIDKINSNRNQVPSDDEVTSISNNACLFFINANSEQNDNFNRQESESIEDLLGGINIDHLNNNIKKFLDNKNIINDSASHNRNILNDYAANIKSNNFKDYFRVDESDTKENINISSQKSTKTNIDNILDANANLEEGYLPEINKNLTINKTSNLNDKEKYEYMSNKISEVLGYIRSKFMPCSNNDIKYSKNNSDLSSLINSNLSIKDKDSNKDKENLITQLEKLLLAKNYTLDTFSLIKDIESICKNHKINISFNNLLVDKIVNSDNEVNMHNNYNTNKVTNVSLLRPSNFLLKEMKDSQFYFDTEEIENEFNTLKMKCFRKVKGDGNCFYRAIVYSYIENLLIKSNIPNNSNNNDHNNKDTKSTQYENNKELIFFIIDCYEDISTKNDLKNNFTLLNSQYSSRNKINFDIIILVLVLLLKSIVNNSNNSEDSNSNILLILNNAVNLLLDFDIGTIFLFKYFLYMYIKDNQNKIFSESFPIKIGNLLPIQYENSKGEFLFSKFYSEFLLKLGVEAEKLVIYLTPFVLNIKILMTMIEPAYLIIKEINTQGEVDLFKNKKFCLDTQGCVNNNYVVDEFFNYYKYNNDFCLLLYKRSHYDMGYCYSENDTENMMISKFIYRVMELKSISNDCNEKKNIIVNEDNNGISNNESILSKLSKIKSFDFDDILLSDKKNSLNVDTTNNKENNENNIDINVNLKDTNKDDINDIFSSLMGEKIPVVVKKESLDSNKINDFPSNNNTIFSNIVSNLEDSKQIKSNNIILLKTLIDILKNFLFNNKNLINKSINTIKCSDKAEIVRDLEINLNQLNIDLLEKLNDTNSKCILNQAIQGTNDNHNIGNSNKIDLTTFKFLISQSQKSFCIICFIEHTNTSDKIKNNDKNDFMLSCGCYICSKLCFNIYLESFVSKILDLKIKSNTDIIVNFNKNDTSQINNKNNDSKQIFSNSLYSCYFTCICLQEISINSIYNYLYSVAKDAKTDKNNESIINNFKAILNKISSNYCCLCNLLISKKNYDNNSTINSSSCNKNSNPGSFLNNLDYNPLNKLISNININSKQYCLELESQVNSNNNSLSSLNNDSQINKTNKIYHNICCDCFNNKLKSINFNNTISTSTTKSINSSNSKYNDYKNFFCISCNEHHTIKNYFTKL